MNKWEMVKTFVNQNKVFTKSQMRKELNVAKSSNYTESQYINSLLNVGIVKRIGRGKYERIFLIPKSLSTSKLSILAYGNSPEDKEIRMKFLKSLTRKQKLDFLNGKN